MCCQGERVCVCVRRILKSVASLQKPMKLFGFVGVERHVVIVAPCDQTLISHQMHKSGRTWMQVEFYTDAHISKGVLQVFKGQNETVTKYWDKTETCFSIGSTSRDENNKMYFI